MSYQQEQQYYDPYNNVQPHSTTDPGCEQYFNEVHFAVRGYIECEHNDCIANRQREEEMYTTVQYASDDDK